MPSFSAAGYLRGLGWKGPGQGLNDSPNARSKPVTVIQKKTLAGVGKDRDEAFPWWEMVFSAVAAKTGAGAGTAAAVFSSSAASASSNQQLRMSKTGILSNRRPVASSSKTTTVDTASTRASGDILGQAKIESARRQLYRSFMRGQSIGGSVPDAEEAAQSSRNSLAHSPHSKKGKAKAAPESDEQSASDKADKASRKQKKDKKRKRSDDGASSLPTPSDSEHETASEEPVQAASPSKDVTGGEHTDASAKRKKKKRRRDEKEPSGGENEEARKKRKKDKKLEKLLRQSMSAKH